tara:strand:+ start:97671 stop:100688 length:3018 start_codon:yes stop_codon:yes gene_type:complete
MKKTVIALALLTLTLSGCSNPIEKIDAYIQEGNYEDAIDWLADEIEDEPENPLYHALMTEVILSECAKTDCFDKAPRKLESLTHHFTKIKDPIVDVDGTSLNLHDRILNVTEGLIKSKHHPKALASINQFMPYGPLLQKLSILTFKKASEHIIKGDIPPANTLTESLSKKLVIKNPNQAMALLLNGYIQNDQDIIKEALEHFKTADSTIPLNDDSIKALPYAIYQMTIEGNPNDGTETFIKDLRKILIEADIPYLNTESGQAQIANAVYAMSRDVPFLDRAKQHSVKTASKEPVENLAIAEDISQTIAMEKERALNIELLKLKFIKLALLTNPKNQKSWDIFLEPAATYAKKTRDASILFEDLAPGDIPSSMINTYNDTLFTIAEDLTLANLSILDVIQHIILPAEGAQAVKTRVTKLLNEAMIGAVNQANYDLVYKYASFQPDIARLSRQKVVSITIEALEKKWQKNEFEGMDKLAEFLSETMGIDFSLDSLLLQSFDDYLTQSGIQKQLNANTSDALLQTKEESKIELGDKFTFLQKHFAKQPEVIDNLLKSLIVKSEGAYATPVSLHKLYTYFSDNFPEKDRHAYLINAIKNSLSEDKSLTALEFALQGIKLQKIYTDIPKTFIVNKTMEKLTTLEESKKLWTLSGDEFKTMLIDTKPQFTTLMRAIEAYDAGNHEKAASLFTILSDVTLIEQARPYLQEYVETVRAQVGAYSIKPNKDALKPVSTKLLFIDLINDKETEESTKLDDQKDLLAVKVTLLSHLGDIKVQSPKDLSEDYGKVSRYEITGRINPNTMEIVIPDNQKSGQGLPVSFEKIFGDLKSLSLEGDRIIYFTNDDSFTFKRVRGYSTQKPNFPDGKYTITSTHDDNDIRSRHVMPVGSIIEFKTDERRAITPKQGAQIMGTIYPIKGVVYHPSSERPRPMDGFYSPDKQLISFSYTYPLINGGTLDAVIRCQPIGEEITCAGHNKHWGRQRYSYIVTGSKIFEKPEPTPSKINRVKSVQDE